MNTSIGESAPITVVIPAHPARVKNGMLNRALASIEDQTLQPEDVVVEYDLNGDGAALTRQNGLNKVQTEWVTFLDSDDEMLPEHLETLYKGALEHNADLVYSWYRIPGGADPLKTLFGKPWDPENPHITTIVNFCKTKLAKQVGFVFQPNGINPGQMVSGEDWYFIRTMNELGAKIVHIPKRTWIWNHHGKNTSGLPNRGDARK